MGVHKRFDSKLYNEYNGQAIRAVLKYVAEDMGLYARVNDDKYGPDIVVYSGLKPTQYIEVEVKKVWKAGTDFPWAEVNLPERKGKFLKSGLPIEFWILREDLQVAIIIPDYVLILTSVEEVSNRLVLEGEMFYKVPLDECIIMELV